jgi:hypothetical protein
VIRRPDRRRAVGQWACSQNGDSSAKWDTNATLGQVSDCSKSHMSRRLTLAEAASEEGQLLYLFPSDMAISGNIRDLFLEPIQDFRVANQVEASQAVRSVCGEGKGVHDLTMSSTAE